MTIYVVSGLYIDRGYPTVNVPSVFKDYEEAKEFLKSKYEDAKKDLITPQDECEREIEGGYVYLCFEDEIGIEWRINECNMAD